MATPSLAAYRRQGGWLGRRLRYYDRIGSTNDVAMAAGREGAPEGLVVIADEQTAGRGRLQRRWQAPPGSSLLLSMLFRPPPPFTYHGIRTTMVCGVALVEAVRRVAGVPAQLKWPNDLIVQGKRLGPRTIWDGLIDAPAPSESRDVESAEEARSVQRPTWGKLAGAPARRGSPDLESAEAAVSPQRPTWGKLAGVLSEVGFAASDEDASAAYLVVGIGLNVNVPAEVLPHLGPHAQSLLSVSGRAVDRVALLNALLDQVEVRYDALKAGTDPVDVWRRSMAWLGAWVEVHSPSGTFTGTMENVDEDGLLLRLMDGELRRFPVGDVSLRLA